MHRRAGVLRERNFRRFYAGYVTSLFGTAMSTVALTFAVLDSGGTPTDLGFVFAAAIVPQVILLLASGVLADRLGRRPVMLTADALRCCSEGTLAVALFLDRPPIWLFVALAVALGAGDAFFRPALAALTVEIAPREELGNANAMLSLANSTTSVAGPALAAILIAVTNPATVIAVDAGTYAASVVALSLLRLPGMARAHTAAPGGGSARASGTAPARGTAPAHGTAPARGAASARSFRGDLRDGWTEFRSRSWLLATTVQFMLFNLVTWGPYLVLGPILARQYLGGARAWGIILAAYGAGSVAGGLLALGRKPHRPVLAGAIATFGYCLPPLLLALHAPLAAVAVGALIGGVGSALGQAFEGTAIQQQVPAEALARVSAIEVFGAFSLGPLAFAAAGPVAAILGARAVLAFGAAWSALVTAAVLTIPSVRAVAWRTAAPDGDATPPTVPVAHRSR